jgi:PilZ domain-containing protein
MSRAGNVAQDRRASRRYDVKTPLRVRVWKSAIPEQLGESTNISEHGMSLATDLPIAVGTVVEVLLKMPEEITGEPAAEWRCTGHVVHVEPTKSSSGEQRVGVQFDCYQVSRS